MFTIRKEQIYKLKEISINEFVLDMIDHVRIYFPEETEPFDNESLEEFIRKILEKAKSYDLKSERDVCKFINLVMVFGFDFDTNSDTIWMYKMLTDESEPNPVVRLNDCYNQVSRRLKDEEAEEIK